MDVKLKSVERSERSRPRWVHARPRGYFSPSFRDYDKKPRLYFSIEGETLLEHFGNRVARPTKLYREFLPLVLQKAGLPTDTKARWSRNAGCGMCPCSPGFILDLPGGGENRFDVWATLEGEEAKVREEALPEVRDRQAQLAAQL